MTKPNHKQIQQACDLINTEARAGGDGSTWNPLDFDVFPSLKVLADTIAQLDVMQAERDKAWADLGEISRLLDQPMVNPARAIAAPYRVETDPLVEAWLACWPEDTGVPYMADKLRAELAKRGLEIGRSA